MDSFILDSLKFKLDLAPGDTIVELGGKIDFAKGPDHTCILIAEKRIVPVLEALGADLPDNLQTVDADFEVIMAGARSEHKTEWVVTEALVREGVNANGNEYNFGHFQKAYDGLPHQFKNEHINRLLSMEHINQLTKRAGWGAQIVCPVMQKWAEDLRGPSGARPSDVQLFTCGIESAWTVYEEEDRQFMRRFMPFQRAIYPSIKPADRIRGLSTDLLSLGS